MQSVQTPNRLIAHLFGPIEGRRQNALMLGVSGLLPKLQHFNKPNGETYVIYGDPAYGLTRNILAPSRGVNFTVHEHEFNKEMSKVRSCVEWGFGKICQTFAYLDFKIKFESPPPTSRKVLPCCCYPDKLSYLFVWISNKLIF